MRNDLLPPPPLINAVEDVLHLWLILASLYVCQGTGFSFPPSLCSSLFWASTSKRSELSLLYPVPSSGWKLYFTGQNTGLRLPLPLNSQTEHSQWLKSVSLMEEEDGRVTSYLSKILPCEESHQKSCT